MADNNKTTYQQLKSGEVKPEGIQKGWLNMKPLTERSPEEQLAIRRKAQARQAEVKREKRTMKEALTAMLEDKELAKALAKANGNEFLIKATESGATVNDLLMLSATLQGLEGNTKALEFIRDTNGQKPKDEIGLQADIITASDRALLDKLHKRIGSDEEDEKC